MQIPGDGDGDETRVLKNPLQEPSSKPLQSVKYEELSLETFQKIL